jgi:tetratricopeptide (TPR) repeat protein
MVVHSKVIAKFNQKKASAGAGAAQAAGAKTSATPADAGIVTKVVEVVPVSAELTAQAEEKKNAGNAAIQKQNYNAAVRHYSDAIDLVPQGETSYVYYSNRAAAHCYLNNYDSAVEDCQSSLALNSTYTKAYSRMGLAYYHLENYEKSVEAYAKCVELEPKVKSHKVNLSPRVRKAS